MYCFRAANYHGLLKLLSFERDAAFVFLPQFSLSLERCDEGFQVLALEECCVDLIIRGSVQSAKRIIHSSGDTFFRVPSRDLLSTQPDQSFVFACIEVGLPQERTNDLECSRAYRQAHKRQHSLDSRTQRLSTSFEMNVTIAVHPKIYRVSLNTWMSRILDPKALRLPPLTSESKGMG